jgi:hypothetical protein
MLTSRKNHKAVSIVNDFIFGLALLWKFRWKHSTHHWHGSYSTRLILSSACGNRVTRLVTFTRLKLNSLTRRWSQIHQELEIKTFGKSGRSREKIFAPRVVAITPDTMTEKVQKWVKCIGNRKGKSRSYCWERRVSCLYSDRRTSFGVGECFSYFYQPFCSIDFISKSEIITTGPQTVEWLRLNTGLCLVSTTGIWLVFRCKVSNVRF